MMANSGAWQVTGQQQSTELIPGGRFVKGVNVSFVTKLGNSGTVFIPEDAYTPDNVRAAVGEKAARVDAVGQLTG
jgi:hypothetical protein